MDPIDKQALREIKKIALEYIKSITEPYDNIKVNAKYIKVENDFWDELLRISTKCGKSFDTVDIDGGSCYDLEEIYWRVKNSIERAEDEERFRKIREGGVEEEVEQND